MLVWASRGPIFASGKRVLLTGNVSVDQFYSGVALSAVLTPAAILIRKICNDFGQLHPFSIAARKHVRIDDLDRIMDIGPLSLLTTFSYSKWWAALQAMLMTAGALLVPIGTLIVTTGQYTPQTRGLSFVGMPTRWQNEMPLSIEISPTPGPENDDFFTTLVASSFKGIIIRTGGLIATTPKTLGPVSTANITFETGVTYDGIISYEWDAGCKPTDEIKYTVDAQEIAWIVNFTFPDGQMNSTDAWESKFLMWSDSKNWTKSGIPIGGTTYFAITGDMNETVSVPPDTSGLAFSNGTWVSRVKCKPSLSWKVSSCVWDGTSMGDCTAAPNHNTTELDIIGLDASTAYLDATLWALQLEGEYMFGLPTVALPLLYYPGTNDHQYQAPSMVDYDNLYGIIAQSIVTASTVGYFGGAMVPTLGQPPEKVYIARISILVIVVLVFVAVLTMSVTDLVYHKVTHLPFRRATFLTVSNAVRGPWWDSVLDGGCVLRPHQLRKQNKTAVKFGVLDLNHVGLGPAVSEVDRNTIYLGARDNLKGNLPG